MAENFALHQGLWNCGTIDGNEGLGGARRKLVNGAGDNFLAGAGFAGDQHGSGTGRGHFDDAHDVLHGLGIADEIAESTGIAQLALQNEEPLFVASLAEGAIEKSAKDWALQRLFDVPEGAGFDGGNGAFLAALAGDDDGRNFVEFVAELLKKVEAIHAGKFDVGDEGVWLKTGKFSEGVFGGAYAKNIVAPALQQLLVAFAGVIFILDNQDAVFALPSFHGANGSVVWHCS